MGKKRAGKPGGKAPAAQAGPKRPRARRFSPFDPGRVRQTATEGGNMRRGGGDLYFDEFRFDAPELLIPSKGQAREALEALVEQLVRANSTDRRPPGSSK